jgi:hypothetical protein
MGKKEYRLANARHSGRSRSPSPSSSPPPPLPLPKTTQKGSRKHSPEESKHHKNAAGSSHNRNNGGYYAGNDGDKEEIEPSYDDVIRLINDGLEFNNIPVPNILALEKGAIVYYWLNHFEERTVFMIVQTNKRLRVYNERGVLSEKEIEVLLLNENVGPEYRIDLSLDAKRTVDEFVPELYDLLSRNAPSDSYFNDEFYPF